MTRNGKVTKLNKNIVEVNKYTGFSIRQKSRVEDKTDN
jgi:hypothetical protein